MPKATSSSTVSAFYDITAEKRSHKVLVEIDMAKSSHPKSLLPLPGATQLALFQWKPFHGLGSTARKQGKKTTLLL